MTDRTQHIDYEAAVKARGAFREASAELMTAGNNAANPPDAMRLGYAAQACDAAESAIFNAFNMLASYLDDQEAGRVLHMREWEPEQTYAGMAVKTDERMPADTATVTYENKAEPVRLVDVAPSFVTESVERCVQEVGRAVEKAYPVIDSAKVGTIHGTSDGGWRVEVRVNDQVFAPRFDTLDRASEYWQLVAEILDRAT